MSGAQKNDQEKVRMELIPGDALDALAKVLTFGAKKYASWNWAKGFEWSRLYGAAQRHLTDWNNGVDKDPETGYSHLWHALCCIVFLVVHEKRGLGTDDRHRWPAPVEAVSKPVPTITIGGVCTTCDGHGFVWADGRCDTKIDCGMCNP